jgi:hypothetical protein
MVHKKIQFPASYKNTLSSEEIRVLAASMGIKFDLFDKFYDSAFGKIKSIVCRIIQDNIGSVQIIDEMQWDRIVSSASWTNDNEYFYRHLRDISSEHKAEALCEISLSDDGVLPTKIAEKVGKLIRDIISENIPSSGIKYDIETLRDNYRWRVELHYSGQLASANNRSMEDDDHGGSDLYRSLSIEKGRLTQAIEEIDLDNCQSIEEAEILLDKIIDGKGIRALKDHLPDIS